MRLSEIRAQIVSVSTSVIGQRPPVDLAGLIPPDSRADTLEEARLGSRPVWFDGGWVEAALYDREKLPANSQLTGPAVLEQMDTTILIEPQDSASTDADGNILIQIGGAE